MKAYCGKIESVKVVDVDHCIVSFSNGGSHRMQHSPALQAGRPWQLIVMVEYGVNHEQ